MTEQLGWYSYDATINHPPDEGRLFYMIFAGDDTREYSELPAIWPAMIVVHDQITHLFIFSVDVDNLDAMYCHDHLDNFSWEAARKTDWLGFPTLTSWRYASSRSYYLTEALSLLLEDENITEEQHDRFMELYSA